MSAKTNRRDEAVGLLRTVTADKAFYFYRGIGQPLGVSSKSLSDFASMVKGIDASSIRFHVERGDFESWFRMLGDHSLADQVGGLRGKNTSPDELKGKVSSMVGNRVDELRRIARPTVKKRRS